MGGTSGSKAALAPLLQPANPLFKRNHSFAKSANQNLVGAETGLKTDRPLAKLVQERSFCLLNALQRLIFENIQIGLGHRVCHNDIVTRRCSR